MQATGSFRLNAIAAIAAASLTLGTAEVAAQAEAAEIRLQAGSFAPGRGESLDIAPGLRIAGYATGQRGYYVVQFAGPIGESAHDTLAAGGTDVLGYLPDNAFKVRMTPGKARQLERADGVAWVGLFHPAYKISPRLTRDGQKLYRARIEAGADADAAIADIEATGAQIVTADGNVVVVLADPAQVDAMAGVLDVAWIENFLHRETFNEYARAIIGGDLLAAAYPSGYTGAGQTIAIADTGLGEGYTDVNYVDIANSRIAQMQAWTGPNSLLCYNVVSNGAADPDSGHGTHVAASALGDGDGNGVGLGAAPGANLVFQAVEDWVDFIQQCQSLYADAYYLMGLPNDLRQLYQAAYDVSVGNFPSPRIHSNSWGSDAAGEYTTDSANTDDFVWNNPDMTITFSAGNAGTDANGDGVVDNDSMGSPATAKNVITVGASENDRQGNWNCDDTLNYGSCGGQNSIFTYGAAWPSDYPANPIADDVSAGNAEQMAAFSSRGPTDDGRIKPDIVAPGTWILSGYSDLYQQSYDGSENPQNGYYQYDGYGYPYDEYYKYLSGTSMANPIVAGAAAVVREYYQIAHGENASAALVKATLINSAIDLLDENNDGGDDNDYPIPNVHEGWGRIDLAAATDGSLLFEIPATGLSTNDCDIHTYSVANAGNPFKATLVWTDYPATAGAAPALVNDLDLTVTAPDGTTDYFGNVFSGGWSATGGSADSVNNVENAYVQSAGTGSWSVEICGTNVPSGPQDYALVIDASTGTPLPNAPPTADFSYTATGLGVDFTNASTDSDGTVVGWSWDFGDGATSTAQSPSHTYAGTGTRTVSLTVTDNDGATDTTSQSVTVTAANVAPSAGFTHATTDLTANFSDTSTDSDGTVTSWLWDFGDGATSSVQSPSHTYAGTGTRTVSLTVTDNDGATDTTSQSVTVTAPSTASAIDDYVHLPSGRSLVIDVLANDSGSGHAVSDLTAPDRNGAVTINPDNTIAYKRDKRYRSGCETFDYTLNGDLDLIATVHVAVGSDSTVCGAPLGNQSPIATFTYDCTDLSCSFDSAGSSDPDGSISSYAWDFGDGGNAAGSTAGHIFAEGTYTVTLTVTDDEGATDAASQTVTVPQVAAPDVHLGNLSDVSAPASRNRWSARVEVTVHDADHNPVSGALVEGSWSAGTNGGGSCTTVAGQCTIDKNNLKGNVSSVTLTVNAVSGDVTYDPDLNDVATTITVTKP